MCGQHNVRVSAEDKTEQNINKGHAPNPRTDIKIPDPAGNRTRAVGLEDNFTQHCQVLNFQFPPVALFGRPLRALSATVPVSRNLEIKHLTVLCEIGSLSGYRFLKFAAMTRKLRSSDIKMTSILSSVVKGIFSYLQQNVL